MIMNENIQKLKEWVQESDNIVFFGGAGVSTESGIPDFRSVDGLYNQKWDYPPETILSHSFFNRYPNSVSPKIYKVSEDELAEHLKTAHPLECDGQKIRMKDMP